MNQTHAKKAFVGLSGGVDSAVSAALLKKAGYQVTGVFIKVWQPDWVGCDWKGERLEAARAAAHLDIPFATLDLSGEYKRGVIDYMITEYAAGRTPNPDVMCNREVKFGAFWRWAQSHGADFIATGHYARIGREIREQDSPLRLLAGTDANKDQSYFLWTLNQDDLSHTLFPVGNLLKSEVRDLAAKLKLPNADKKDSQGLCFIGKVDVKGFLKRYIKAERGDVLDGSGKIIGAHPGALLFTIGERHGFTVHQTSPNDKPFFVISKDVTKNTLTVSNRDSDMRSNRTDRSGPHPDRRAANASEPVKVKLSRANWIEGELPSIGAELKARGRYRQPLQGIKIVSAARDQAVISFTEKQDALAPGQSLVIYDGEKCLGGGIIEA